jgi:signal transduction histidine kinase
MKGHVDTTLAHVPTHVEYILTELLKNAFRATVENGKEREAVEITIAAAPDVKGEPITETTHTSIMNSSPPDPSSAAAAAATPTPLPSIPGVTIRIRDRGGGISPENLPNIWAYSFTTFSDNEIPGPNNGTIDGLNSISGAGGDSSSLAGLGYGLPLGRAYAEYFGGGIAVQSLWGWGTDVYLKLHGLGRI